MASVKMIEDGSTNHEIQSVYDDIKKTRDNTKHPNNYRLYNLCQEREYDYKSKVFFKDLGDFKKIGKQVSEKAVKKLNSRKLKTCKSDVIFDSKVSSSLLRNLFTASNAPSIVKGISFLKNKKIDITGKK